MDIAVLSAVSALAGSVIGGLTTGATSWASQRAQARAGQIAHDFQRREDLYRDFIVAASKIYGDALMSSEPRIPELIGLYSMISRMRVLSHPRTIACADKVVVTAIDTYFEPNKTIRELNDLMKSGSGIDPLKDFSEAARDELRALPPR